MIKRKRIGHVFSNRWVSLFCDDVLFADGQSGQHIRLADGRPGVVVLPICGRKVGLISQYRYPVGRQMLEAPRGFGCAEKDRDSALHILQRECEARLHRTCLVRLGSHNPDSGILADQVEIFAAEVGDITDTSHLAWHDGGDVLEMIRTGEITDGFTKAAVLHAMLEGLLPI